MNDIFEEVKGAFKKSIENLFSTEVRYGFITGSFAYKNPTKFSDIDIVIVLDPNGKNQEILKSKRYEFTEEYLKIHDEYNLNPDTYFPGEIISQDMIYDAINGRGYKIKEGLYLEDIIYEEQWDDPELEYRCWRSMLAFNNNQFLTGDKKQFEEDRLLLNIEIAKYLLIEHLKTDGFKEYNISELKTLLINKILSGERKFLGLRNGSETYQNDLKEIYAQVFPILTQEGFVSSNHNKIIPNKEKLMEWEHDKIYKLENGLFNTPHLFN
ncbi:MAG: hypothetical protein DRP06_00070 [Candidatus Aenigmatarchaeota archaeon]|nr:MAG: hypothetical protein DRP06_00070 [Candidatus Aenigmarchaeota archaeon]